MADIKEIDPNVLPKITDCQDFCDYVGMPDVVETAKNFLRGCQVRNAINLASTGRNIPKTHHNSIVFGLSGTGKTQLAQTIALSMRNDYVDVLLASAEPVIARDCVEAFQYKTKTFFKMQKGEYLEFDSVNPDIYARILNCTSKSNNHDFANLKMRSNFSKHKNKDILCKALRQHIPVRLVTASTIIGVHIGESSNNMQRVLSAFQEGVLVIDEVDNFLQHHDYGLSALDTLNVHMSTSPNAPCIVATAHAESEHRLFFRGQRAYLTLSSCYAHTTHNRRKYSRNFCSKNGNAGLFSGLEGTKACSKDYWPIKRIERS